MNIRFAKGHGTGNDFVLLPDIDGDLELSAEQVRTLCDRRFGIGADGVLRIVRSVADGDASASAGEAEFFMDYRNADGSKSEMCGNGARVFGRYLVDTGLVPAGSFSVATRGGVRTLHVPVAGDVAVLMGVPHVIDAPAEVAVSGRWRSATAVTIPNPHLVVAVDDVVAVGDLSAPPEFRGIPDFANGANIEFVAEAGPNSIRMRVHERGVGETLSCGTGACAAAWVAMRRDRAAPGTDYRVAVPGGVVTVTETEDGQLQLAGPAVVVAEGSIHSDWWTAG